MLRGVLRVAGEMGAAITVKETSVGTDDLRGTVTVILEMRSSPALTDLVEAFDDLDGVTEAHATSVTDAAND